MILKFHRSVKIKLGKNVFAYNMGEKNKKKKDNKTRKKQKDFLH